MTPRSDRKEIELRFETIDKLELHAKRQGWTMELLMDHIMSPLRDPYSLEPSSCRPPPLYVTQHAGAARALTTTDDDTKSWRPRDATRGIWSLVKCPCCEGRCKNPFGWRGIRRCGCPGMVVDIDNVGSQGIADGKFAKAKLDRRSGKPHPIDRRYRP